MESGNHSAAEQSRATAPAENTSGMGSGFPLPPGISKWSWGAFLLNGIWAIFNKTWIGLLSFIPFVGWIMLFMLGYKGREWAWRNNRWRDIEHFNEVQKRWSFWGVLIIVVLPAIIVIAAMAISASLPKTGDTDGGDTPPTAAIQAPIQAMNISAIDLYAAYKTNEIAADQKFKGQTLAVTGIVDSIDSDFNDDPRVALRGEPGDSFLAFVYAEGIDKAHAATLRKNQTITVICTADGEVMGFPGLSDCEIQNVNQDQQQNSSVSAGTDPNDPATNNTLVRSHQVSELDTVVENQAYWKLSTQLNQAGYQVDDSVREEDFPNAFAGNLARCPDSGGCYVPWKGKGQHFCVFSMGNDMDPADWNAGLVRNATSGRLSNQCP